MLKLDRFNSALKLAFQFQKPGFRGARRARAADYDEYFDAGGFSALGELEGVVVSDGALGCGPAGVAEGVGEGGEEHRGAGGGGECGRPVAGVMFRMDLALGVCGGWGGRCE
jgi:hypothetical protein